MPDNRDDSDFTPNNIRGCSYFFGQEACRSFLERNNLRTIFRAHEVQLKGYKLHRWQGSTFPSVITVFSAPNYCDSYGNEGAIAKLVVHNIH
jgi:serine/threonine-protein phosphatase 2B catalytic subunit